MLYFNNWIFVSSTGTAIREIAIGTRFHFENYGGIIRAKIVGENILNGELIGMVNQLGQLEAIFNYCNSDSKHYSGTCSFTLEKIHNKRYKLHGLWVLAGDDTIENELVLEEQLYNI
ncbi:hypothetical protein [Neobacillus cucumis]|uniref:hypothetical protein n=1 Tax=Neobacillus cucumis TaxID=1740721 RepID=UPI002E23F7B1|nr:hypothetical protein [Neobacillus cucumis]